jgi:hypothetical protein
MTEYKNMAAFNARMPCAVTQQQEGLYESIGSRMFMAVAEEASTQRSSSSQREK